MIVNAILGFMSMLINAIASLLPTWEWPAELSLNGSLSSFTSAISQAAYFLPLATAVYCILAIMGVYVLRYEIKILQAIIGRKILP